MATFTVDTAQVASSATDVSRISEDVETTVASMMSRLISLQNDWQGDASTSFPGPHQRLARHPAHGQGEPGRDRSGAQRREPDLRHLRDLGQEHDALRPLTTRGGGAVTVDRSPPPPPA
uniref:WXG100 family type VII secretion target n=1 Tax=Janibacter limosus TaxID=53458 RepID=A0AC61U586_9MICO|nr:WXG100 family type VII secretion target [Janibacter limosus]